MNNREIIFWSRVNIGSDDECWESKGGEKALLKKAGYNTDDKQTTTTTTKGENK